MTYSVGVVTRLELHAHAAHVYQRGSDTRHLEGRYRGTGVCVCVHVWRERERDIERGKEGGSVFVYKLLSGTSGGH